MAQASAAAGPSARRVAVIGAGMVGLSTAWFLQQRGASVVVYERDHVGAGASWGNAGWLSPGLVTPLPEPAVLRYGLRALLAPASPLYVPPTLDRRLLSFLLRFARNSTASRWSRAMAALAPINAKALPAFDALAAGGVEAPTHPAPTFLAAFRAPAERSALHQELAQLADAGQPVDFRVLTGDEARATEPALSDQVRSAIQLAGQRFIDPGVFVQHLAHAVRARGGQITEATRVTGLAVRDDRVTVTTPAGSRDAFDTVVLATGAWLGHLARPLGMRAVVAAGRGYSFSVAADPMPASPVYFPDQRVACTPLENGRLRVAGMMEFRPPDAALDPRRIRAIVDATRPLLRGADLDTRLDEWVGPRPCTADGLPLIGRTTSARVFVAGGHGMWGITLGPATGQLLAKAIITGTVPAALAGFDPLR